MLHGGLFSDDNITLDDIKKIDRISKKQPGNTGLMMVSRLMYIILFYNDYKGNSLDRSSTFTRPWS